MPSDNTTAAIDNLAIVMGGFITPITAIGAALTLLVAALQLVKLFELSLLLGILAIAFWQKDSILFMVSGIIIILISVQWMASYPGVVVTLWGLAVYLLSFKGLIPMLATGGRSRGLSQFKSMFHKGGG